MNPEIVRGSVRSKGNVVGLFDQSPHSPDHFLGLVDRLGMVLCGQRGHILGKEIFFLFPLGLAKVGAMVVFSNSSVSLSREIAAAVHLKAFRWIWMAATTRGAPLRTAVSYEKRNAC